MLHLVPNPGELLRARREIEGGASGGTTRGGTRCKTLHWRARKRRKMARGRDGSARSADGNYGSIPAIQTAAFRGHAQIRPQRYEFVLNHSIETDVISRAF